MRKGPLCTGAQFLFLIAHNFKIIVATGLKPGMAILQSLHCTCCKFCAPSTSNMAMAVASITCS